MDKEEAARMEGIAMFRAKAQAEREGPHSPRKIAPLLGQDQAEELKKGGGHLTAGKGET
jgi:hypothetical protein